ncbi:glucokinase [Asticcacaulis sp. SL142]|nr:glucokinase [Asticcacaulis sp. SL142]
MLAQVLFVDFSGDNSVRITTAEPGRRPPAAQLYRCQSLGEFDKALENFLASANKPDLLGAAFSICGWEQEGTFEMPNLSYRINRNWIKERLGIRRLNIVNDCVATALAIDHLEVAERRLICGSATASEQIRAMIAVGRGLGTASILTDELGNSVAYPCAGGHSDLPATTDREFAVVRWLRQKYGHVSRVRAISSAGLAEVYYCLMVLDGLKPRVTSVTQVVALARDGDMWASDAVKLVTGWLAAMASDTVLCVGARGGLYLAGSYFDMIGNLFDSAHFTTRFYRKGRLESYLQNVPVYLVKTHEPEMLGLSTLFGR